MIEKIPPQITTILLELKNAGFQANIVGGCVRDIIMNRIPHDYDVSTDAVPSEIMSVFSSYNCIPTGIKHGTVTVIIDEMPVEITTYRIENSYSDNRHPDTVMFTTSIENDLVRRDFTMNSIACNLNDEIIDLFDGILHIKNHIVVCTGDPEKRFSEDALRILRCLRFASELNFKIENKTAIAVHKFAEQLNFVSVERINSELDRLICGKGCYRILMEYSDVIAVFIPEIKKCFKFCQNSPYHKYDVWEHIVTAVSNSENDIVVRRTMLLHDIAKPLTYKEDKNGRGHFKGHAEIGSEVAVRIMKRLHYDKKSIKQTSELIYFHSCKIKNEMDIKKILSKLGKEQFYRLIDVKNADDSAKEDFVQLRIQGYKEIKQRATEIINNNVCISTSQLNINGKKIIELGSVGKQTGEILNELLYLVMDGKLENSEKKLIERAKGIISGKFNKLYT